MLSVIIPIYRVEKTLDRCVQSIVSQTYRNLEVILVDDGSPDRSPELCDQWAERDSRVRVLHQKNCGLSEARNAGIDAARGEWLMFADSDDYLGEGTLEQVMVIAEENDIVEFPAYRFYGSNRQSVLTFQPHVYEDMEDYWLRSHAYEHAYVWNKVYRRNLFDGIRFPKGIVFEDVHTLPRLLQKTRRLATTNQGMYYYCWNNQGITATAGGAALTSLLKAHLATGWMDDRCYLYALNVQIDVYERTGEVLLPYRPVSIGTPDISAAQKVKAALLRMLGVKGVCRLFHTFHKLKKLC